MNTKLTLSIKDQVIRDAEHYAKQQGKSLSNIVEEYLKSLTSSSKEDSVSDQNLSDAVMQLRDCVKVDIEDQSYEEILADALLEKYRFNDFLETK